MITTEDLRPNCLVELEAINKLMQRVPGNVAVPRIGSAGAVERGYMLALGLLERDGDCWWMTPKGADVLLQHWYDEGEAT
jgi:hypothetical protein